MSEITDSEIRDLHELIALLTDIAKAIQRRAEEQSADGTWRKFVVSPMLALIQADPHQWSTRPCATCRSVSAMAGEPFGCEKRAKA